jgi:predicted AAA+ superfamily ATPase
MMARTLAEVCTPRQSVFDPSIRDTVYDIGRLNEIDPQQFFAENYVTMGMRQLLSEAFTRLEGVSDNAPGVFLLSQSMGGGKTHNLLALGLLA